MSEESFREANVEEVKQLLAQGYELIDVRDDWEWERGHLPGARHVPLTEILANPGGQSFNDRTVFQCAVGNRSAVASEMAVALGAKDVINFRGGFDAWKEAGLPVEKP